MVRAVSSTQMLAALGTSEAQLRPSPALAMQEVVLDNAKVVGVAVDKESIALRDGPTPRVPAAQMGSGEDRLRVRD
jgi:hypothetical protein